MLFQIADDVDDLFATAMELGREPGADLAAGVISLLGAFALQSPAKADAADVLAGPTSLTGRAAVDRARALVRSSGALEATYETANRYARSARRLLAVVPMHEGATWMGSLVDATLARVERCVDGTH